VLGRPEIWSRLRIVAIFDDELKEANNNPKDFALVQPNPTVLELDEEVAEDVLDPVTDMRDIYEHILCRIFNRGNEKEPEDNSNQKNEPDPNQDKGGENDDGNLKLEEGGSKLLEETDVIFAMSAAPRYVRSLAHYSDWIEEDGGYRLTEDVKLHITKALENKLDKRLNFDKLKNLDNELFIGRRKYLKTIIACFEEAGVEDAKSKLEEFRGLLLIAGKLPRQDPNPPTEEYVEYIKDLESQTASATKPPWGVPYDYNPDPNGDKRDEIEQEFTGKMASFKLTEKTLDNLKSEELPDYVTNKLKRALKDHEVTGAKEFLGKLKSTIGKEQTDTHKALILKHAASFKLSEKTLDNLKSEGLPDDVTNELKRALKDHEVTGEKEFLGKLKLTIGKEQTDTHKALILKHATNFKTQFAKVHEYYAKNPGRVALNVLGATARTFVHEFAHAMSSVYHGPIVDEYYDKVTLPNDEDEDVIDSSSARDYTFYINRIEKANVGGRLVPVHRVFARYQNTVFLSDLDHPSAEEGWTGYFPERESPDIACTMDRSYGRYRFDKLIATFMYDRLIAKINRL
jgi:hypothetical protein